MLVWFRLWWSTPDWSPAAPSVLRYSVFRCSPKNIPKSTYLGIVNSPWKNRQIVEMSFESYYSSQRNNWVAISIASLFQRWSAQYCRDNMDSAIAHIWSFINMRQLFEDPSVLVMKKLACRVSWKIDIAENSGAGTDEYVAPFMVLPDDRIGDADLWFQQVCPNLHRILIEAGNTSAGGSSFYSGMMELFN